MAGTSEWEIINESKSVGESLALWLLNNGMKVNPDKLTFEEHVVGLYKNLVKTRVL